MNGLSTSLRPYRAYHLSVAGRIVRAEILEAKDDGDALSKLEARADDHAVELWDRSRFIGKVEAAQPDTVSTTTDMKARVANAQTNRMSSELFRPLFVEAPDADDLKQI